jgi:hypothetical protein
MGFWNWLFGVEKKKSSPKPPKPLLLPYKGNDSKQLNVSKQLMSEEQKSEYIVSNFRQYLNEKLRTDEEFRKQTLSVIRRWLNETNTEI